MRQRLSEYENPDPPFRLVDGQREHEEPAERPRRLPSALLTVAAIAVFAGGLWFAYQQGARNASVSPAASSDTVPPIRADEQPAPPMGAMLTPVGPAPLSPSAPAGTDAAPKSTKPGAAPAAKAPASANGIRIQLGSVRSAEAAREKWSRLKQANPDVLGKLSAVAVRADLGDKGIYYRIQAGPLADAAAGDHLCSELKKRNLGCTLVR